MSAFSRLIIAGIAAALISAPAAAMEPTKTASAGADTTVAQQDCRGWGVTCDFDVAPTYCIADDKCAVALTGSALVRYDQRMDAALAN